jgi:hypothetical protein
LEWLENTVAPLPSTSEAKTEFVIAIGAVDDKVVPETSPVPEETGK